MTDTQDANQQQQPTILIVDDDALMRRLLILHLQLEFPHASFLEAATGQMALDLANTRRPDLVLLDGFLPLLNGADVAAALRRNPQLCAIPIIALTAAGPLSPLPRLLRRHCDLVFSKPGRMDEVRSAARAMLQTDRHAYERPAGGFPLPPQQQLPPAF